MQSTTLTVTLALTCSVPAVAQTEVAILRPSDGRPGDRFGWEVALDGDVALVGAPGAGGPQATAIDVGAVYVFERTAGGWVETQKLVASDPRAGDLFGSALAQDGGWAAVGAPGPDSDGPGVVTLFERTPAGWIERHRLSGAGGDAVALGGTRILVGRLTGPLWWQLGEITVLERTAGALSRIARFDGYGGALDLDGDRVAGGRPYNAGVYRKVGSAWQEEASLGPGCCHNRYGWRVALQGSTLAVSDTYGSWSFFEVHRFDGLSWQLVQTLLPPEQGSFGIGQGLDLEGDRMLVGDGWAGTPDLTEWPGAAYLYRRSSAGSWAPAAKLVASDGEYADLFGWSADLCGDRVLVGAPGSYFDDTRGKAYVFEITDVARVSCVCSAAPPCGNAYPLGGCVSSRDLGALLGASGSASVTADDLVLSATQLPRDGLGLVLMGDALGTPVPLAAGLRCVTGQLFRFPPRATGPGGVFDEGPGLVAHSQTFPAGGHIAAGATWHFQAWVRDPQGPCGGGSNLTNALSVTFTP